MADWLRAPDLTAAKHVILKHLSPKADKTGALNYSMPDGGTVKDTTAGIRVVQSTDAAALLALTLAAEKYAGQTLIIAGSDAFRQQVARLAGEHGVNVEFADASLEQTRTFAIRPTATAPAATPAPEKPPAVKPQEKPPTAIESFLLERNSQRKFSSTIVYHRAWTAQDAGAASYQGRRRLSDGSEIVLLQKGDTMLALPVTGAQAAKAAQWRVGTEIATDARGRFVSQQQRPSTPTKGKTR